MHPYNKIITYETEYKPEVNSVIKGFSSNWEGRSSDYSSDLCEILVDLHLRLQEITSLKNLI